MGVGPSRRRVLVITLSVCLLLLFLSLAALNAFNVNFLNPSSPLQTLVFISLSVIAFLLFVAVLVLLVRNVLKLYVDQRSRVLGTRLRTRMLWGAVLVSLVPLVFMFAFSYLLMNRAVDRWFSQPVTQMHDDANSMALELYHYAAANARSDADAMASELANPPLDDSLPLTPAALDQINRVLQSHEITLQGGFVLLYRNGQAIASLHVPSSPSGKSELRSIQPAEPSTNESYRRVAIQRGGVPPENIFVVRNGPDLTRFIPVAPNPALKHGKPFLVGYVGTMGEQEGLDILLEAAAEIKRRGREEVHFTCVGGGPALESLRQMVKSLRLEDTVNFTGRIPDADLIEILSTADVCVNPDIPCEMNDMSTMIKIAEYMAMGKPIVQFDLREGRYTAADASLYCEPTQLASGFADKILWLLDHPDERKRMGEFGKMRVKESLAWEYSVQHLCNAYERALTMS